MKTPILFLIFNRPETTKKVFEKIREQKPEKLFIAADGPRDEKPEEDKLCKESRKIATQIDWACEVKTLFREKNIGCKYAISSAIDWFFENVEQGIILEDDCLPSKSFFYFCEELLKKYSEYQNIMHISGSNLQFGQKFGNNSYYFSHCPHVWGWATWKKAWNKYDLKMDDLYDFINSNKTYEIFRNKELSLFWNSLFRYTKEKKVDTWDIQWNYSLLKNKGLSITPNINLVKNIGFGPNSTHTKEENSKLQQETNELSDILHPDNINADLEADYQIYRKVYFRNIFDKIKSKIRIFKKLFQ